MQHAFHFRLVREPARDFQRRRFDRAETQPQRLQTAQGEAAVVGRDGTADDLSRRAEPFVDRVVAHGDRAEQQVAVAADVFRDGLHRDVHAVRERVEEYAGRPRVVEHDRRAARVRSLGDRGHVLHFHRHRAGALGPDEARVRPDELRDRAAHRRFVEIRFDAEAREERRGQLLVRPIDAARDEDVVATLQQREVDQRDRGLAAGREDRVPAALELANAGRQLERRRRAVEAVGIADALLIPRVADVGRGREERGRSAMDRRGQRTIAFGHAGLGVEQPSLPGRLHLPS